MSRRTALLIVDVQLGMFNPTEPVHGGEALLGKLGELIAKARTAGAPLAYIQHCGPEGHPLQRGQPGWVVHPAIAPRPDALVIQKRHPDSFQDTPLDDELRKQGINRLVVAGIATEGCIDTTCRRAYSLDYEVILVQDAHSTWDRAQLTAPQIIAHHNDVLTRFATVKEARDVSFDNESTA